MLEIVFGQILEAIYFSLFLICTKRVKEKRLLFTILMIAEYLLLKRFIKYDVLFNLLYTFFTYFILKLVYKEKAIITDIFMFALSSIILMIISVFSYAVVYFTIRNFYVALALNRVLLFGILFLFRNKLNKIYILFNSLWDRRKDNIRPPIRSLTLRNICIIVFNFMFYGINTLLIYFLTNLK